MARPDAGGMTGRPFDLLLDHMSTIWSIGGQSLADLGLKLAGGTFRTGAASEMTLVRTGPFEAAQTSAMCSL